MSLVNPTNLLLPKGLVYANRTTNDKLKTGYNNLGISIALTKEYEKGFITTENH
jgi:hypothetical protein